MSLNPSNGIAQRVNPDKQVFPNLARHVPEGGDPAIFAEVDAACKAELEAAGIPLGGAEFIRHSAGGGFREVPTKHVGSHCLWGFRRAWYYWVATGPGVPPDKAEEFHRDWGTQVRVEGHCGCPSPLEFCHGFAVGQYHIDTQEGLNAFAAMIRSIYRP